MNILSFLFQSEEEIDDDERMRREEEKSQIIRAKDRVITGSADTSVKIWNLHSGECLYVSNRVRI